MDKNNQNNATDESSGENQNLRTQAIVKKLVEKKIFTDAEADEIYTMEPFPILKIRH